MRLDILKALNAGAARAARRVIVTARRRRAAPGQGRALRRDPLAARSTRRCASGKSGIVEIAGEGRFLTVHVPAPQLVIIGAVHISQALAPIAQIAGLDVTIIDPRTAFATPERFPDMTVVAEWPDEALAAAPLDRYTAFCR